MIITPKPLDPEVQSLSSELNRRGYNVRYFVPASTKVKINIHDFHREFEDIEGNKALVRGFGADVTQKIFFRLDLLTAIELHGTKLINSRNSLEIASDKFLTSVYLERHGISTPKTIICENAEDAIEAFDELGGDIVLKPLFGSKGVGVTRINNKSFAENVFYTLEKLNDVFYLQEFVEHYNRDIRILVLGNKAIAGMYRKSDNWKTNIHAGARSEPIDLTSELSNMAIKAAQITKTEIAGVDIIESEKGYQVIEVNSIPGYKGLQRVTEINLVEEIISYFLEC